MFVWFVLGTLTNRGDFTCVLFACLWKLPVSKRIVQIWKPKAGVLFVFRLVVLVVLIGSFGKRKKKKGKMGEDSGTLAFSIQ